jgi:heme oxygenase (mycobilin-producing)
MTITSILDLHVKPEDAAGAPAVLRNILTATRNFDGNLGVEVFLDEDDPTHFVAIERWESLEADTAYRAWRQTPDGASILGSILAGAPTLSKLHLTDI